MTPAIPAWPGASAERFVDDLLAWFAHAGSHRYDESVTQLEHGLQSAFLARRAGDDDAAVAAALLHDIGHLLASEPDDEAAYSTDLEHEEVGARWLERVFPEEVTAPIRGHVAAKRYLCSVEPAYHDRLSAGSVRSLKLQGGLLPAAEVAQMEAEPSLGASVALRRRDDAAKIPGRQVPGLETYRELLVGLVAAR
jgi:phosphonate degradation associated HDIG domain protein